MLLSQISHHCSCCGFRGVTVRFASPFVTPLISSALVLAPGGKRPVVVDAEEPLSVLPSRGVVNAVVSPVAALVGGERPRIKAFEGPRPVVFLVVLKSRDVLFVVVRPVVTIVDDVLGAGEGRGCTVVPSSRI